MAPVALFPSSASSSSSSLLPFCHCNLNRSSHGNYSAILFRLVSNDVQFRRLSPAPAVATVISPTTTTIDNRNPVMLRQNYRTHKLSRVKFRVSCVRERAAEPGTQLESPSSPRDMDCVGTGLDVECVIGNEEDQLGERGNEPLGEFWEWVLLISPFFFWGTAMVAMKEVLPKTGPFFISSFRLIPAGFLLVAFAASRGRPLPSGLKAWLSISLFALVDATCFQGFLAEGLQRTSAGLGSVIIDSQPLTVAVLAAALFGESIGFIGAAGLVLGVIGLLLLEVPALSLDGVNSSLWGSGELWMLLAAQSMAVGTVMVRWVTKYSDPVMATGWHMVIGGLPLIAFSFLNHDPAVNGSLLELTSSDLLALLYTSLFGSAFSYGAYFYNATRGSLTKLSSLTFLTPMFASIFGFFYLGETFSPVQLGGAFVTVAAIYMVNYKNASE